MIGVAPLDKRIFFWKVWWFGSILAKTKKQMGFWDNLQERK